MADRLLRKCDIAAMPGTTPAVAASILSNHGCNPIDFGYGRSRGACCLESAVLRVLREMHVDVQTPEFPESAKIKKLKAPQLNLANMRLAEVYSLLTPGQPVQ